MTILPYGVIQANAYLLGFQGGSGPAYQAIEKLCVSDPGYAIEINRLPSGFLIHRDPKHWKRAELTAYHKYIHAGQRGELKDSDIFQYRLLFPDRQKEPKFCLETIHERDPHSTLKYTRGELLRGTAVSGSPQRSRTHEPLEGQWNGLPLARTSHVYLCFRGELFKNILALH